MVFTIDLDDSFIKTLTELQKHLVALDRYDIIKHALETQLTLQIYAAEGYQKVVSVDPINNMEKLVTIFNSTDPIRRDWFKRVLRERLCQE